MIKLYLTIVSLIKKRRFIKNATLGKNVVIRHTAGIYLLHGSNQSNVKIGDNATVQGTLVSSNNGNIVMGKHSRIGVNSYIRCVEKVALGDFTIISDNVVISDNNNHPVNPNDRMIQVATPLGSDKRSWIYSDHSPIIIGENVWIGEYARICKGVNIGDGSIIAANAVVTKDIPANCIAAGNPARIVKTDIDKMSSRMFAENTPPSLIGY